MKTLHGKLFGGTSGLVVPIAKNMYPAAFQQKSRLSYYASVFNSLEVNSSFYKLPRPATIIKWAEEVPPHFKFTFKLPKQITHTEPLASKLEEVQKFIDAINHVGDKRGCILVQLPPSAKVDSLPAIQQLIEHLLEADSENGWRIAIEFRNVSWYAPAVLRVLSSLQVAVVDHDMPASATPHLDYATKLRYVRFHGPGGRYRGSYDKEILSSKAAEIRSWVKRGDGVFVYFNNTMGDAYYNLQTLNELVGSL